MFADSVPYLKLAGTLLAGWPFAGLSVVTEKRSDDPSFYEANSESMSVPYTPARPLSLPATG